MGTSRDMSKNEFRGGSTYAETELTQKEKWDTFLGIVIFNQFYNSAIIKPILAFFSNRILLIRSFDLFIETIIVIINRIFAMICLCHFQKCF